MIGRRARIIAGLVAAAVVGTTGVVVLQSSDEPSSALAATSDCWDEYTLTGTAVQRVVRPVGVSNTACTVPAFCLEGFTADGVTRNRIYAPHGRPKSTCTSPPPTTTSPPTTVTTTTLPPSTTTTSTTVASTTTVPSGTHFSTLPVGAALSTEAQCATRVRLMTENRPTNAGANATRGTDPNNLYPRVTGNFAGTTDEILQWVACKWGIDEDIVRAQIVVESFWQQDANGDNGESFGLGQVRAPYHGTAFEDNNAVESSAYNVDYTYAVWRSCFEGEMTWLNTVEHGATYSAGDERGCLGVWFAGRYRTAPALQYMATVDQTLRDRVWEQANFPPARPVTGGTTTTSSSTTSTTTTSSSTTTTTGPTTTTIPPPPVAFVETFTGNTGIDHFRKGVYQRNVDVYGFEDFSGGSWRGDHAVGCAGGVGYTDATTRALSWNTNESMAQRVATAFYNCNDHMMTSMGDVDAYSVVWFSPNRTFTNVSRVCWDVNLTNMGNRQWWEVAVVPQGENELFADVDAADLPPQGPNTVVVKWNSINATRKIALNNFAFGVEFDTGTDKASRYQHCLIDNNNGTLTVQQNRPGQMIEFTRPGSLPNGVVTVMFKDHKYTPDKAEHAFQRPAYSWHWDNIVVE